ncbi:hypothetical protein GE061_010452 [Apolygus lucorum]|uniref:Uncharacterized protein n=1 Tax=Apolygus lucorum TaxID=248454 RepID=A0A8S9XVX5_APOLU|nr:hypothetical protein GE061_010452 [Apolygus lucorum]
MEEEIVVKEEPMEEGEATEVVLLIKHEVLIGDGNVEEGVGNNERVENEVEGYPMIEQDHNSTGNPLGDVSDCEVLQGSMMKEGEAIEVDLVMEEAVMLKQEVLIGDEHVEEEIGNNLRMNDDVEGFPIIEQEHKSPADPLGDIPDSDVLQESIEIQKLSEAEPPISRGSLAHFPNPYVRRLARAVPRRTATLKKL